MPSSRLGPYFVAEGEGQAQQSRIKPEYVIENQKRIILQSQKFDVKEDVELF